MRGLVHLRGVLTGLLLLSATSAGAQKAPITLTPHDELKNMALRDIAGFIVCGDSMSTTRGLYAAWSVAEGDGRADEYYSDGTCFPADKNADALLTGRAAVVFGMHGRCIVVEALIVDVYGYIVIPAPLTPAS